VLLRRLAAASMSRSYSTSRWSATKPTALTSTPRSAPAWFSEAGQLVDDLQDVGAEPRLRRAAGALPGDGPVAPLAQTGGGGDGLGGGAQLVRVRVAGVDDALGSEWAVNSTFVLAGIAASLARRSAAMNCTNAGSVAQLSMPLTVMPCGSAAARARSRYWPMENAE
jgi:hypothetical protein